MNNQLYNSIKNNIGNNKIYMELRLNELKKKTYDDISGIYIIVHKKELYIGKSINLFERLKEHLTLIKNKKHYNKHFNKWIIEDCLVMLLKINNIDKAERYYITKFKKNYKLINIHFPSYEGKREDFKINKYKILNLIMLKKLNKYHNKTFNKIFYNDIPKYNDNDIHRLKNIYLLFYTKFIEYNDILNIQKAYGGFNYHIHFKNGLYILAPINKKELNKILITDLIYIKNNNEEFGRYKNLLFSKKGDNI